MKDGKTESVLFATAKKLAQNPQNLNLSFRNFSILSTKVYKYLGTTVDDKILLNDHFENIYKKASSRLRYLYSLRHNLTVKAATHIYTMTIVPLVLFNNTTQLVFTKNQSDKLSSLHRRAINIIRDPRPSKILDIQTLSKVQACRTVKKCLDQNICKNFHNYFKTQNHSICTRGQGNLISLPKMKLQSTKKAFFFSRAKLFNELPLSLRSETNFLLFRKKLKESFL